MAFLEGRGGGVPYNSTSLENFSFKVGEGDMVP